MVHNKERDGSRGLKEYMKKDPTIGHGGDQHNPATKARKEVVKKDQNIENIKILTGK